MTRNVVFDYCLWSISAISDKAGIHVTLGKVNFLRFDYTVPELEQGLKF